MLQTVRPIVPADLHPTNAGHSIVLQVDMSNRITACSNDGFGLLDAVQDVLFVTEHGTVSMPLNSQFDDALACCLAGQAARICQIQAFSERSGSNVTVFVLPATGPAAKVVVLISGLSLDAHLTRREQGVLSLFAKGLRRDRIAHELALSIATVDFHTANLRKKLGAKTTAEAVAKALAGNLVRDPSAA